MKKEIVEVKTWFSSEKPEISYTARFGDKYLLCNDGSVFFNEYESVLYHDSSEFEVPHSTDKNKWVCEMNGVFGVYDSNMKLLQKYNSIGDFIDDLTEPYSRWNKSDFMWFEYL